MLRTVFKALHGSAAVLRFGVASYRQPDRRGDFTHVRRVQAARDSLMTPLEGVQVIAAVRATQKLAGCMAEVGVYAGASARLIRETDDVRPLHLFDTFSGLPETHATDTEFRGQQFQQGDFACSLASVQHYLRDLSGITYHQGLFPDTAAGLFDLRFSFVHVDVDIYESARAAVDWFYDRLLPGGIYLSHDFATCEGPRRALTDFFADKPEPLLELPGDQVVAVKL